MKHLAVAIGMILGCMTIQAQTPANSLEQIIINSYDSICIEMIKTAYDIVGIKDSTSLKEISEGRVDSALAHHPRVISKSMAQLITQLNKEFDVRKCDELARRIRADLMGQLLIQNYRAENKILLSYDIHKKDLDSLKAEIGDFLKAQKESDFTHFQEKHPKSKINTLINKQDKKQDDAGWKNIIPYMGILVVALIAMIAISFLIYELRKKNKALSDMQQQGKTKQTTDNSKKGNDDNKILTVKQKDENQQIESCHYDDSNKLNNTDEKVDVTKINAFAERNDNCIVVGTSVIGNSHVSMGLPCQDNCRYTYIRGGWGIAITSDGAGSAKHSEIGSRIVTERGIHYFRSVIEQKEWIENGILPTEAEWTNIAYTTLKAIKDDMKAFANTKNLEFGSLSATIIVVIHTPLGFLTTHVGDGRAGYKDETSEWKSLITPHKGEEANQTIFLTSDFWKVPYCVMSGVMVPESHVVRCRPIAFTLMSDGCEHTAWQCNMRNENTGVYYDPNKPFDRFFNPLVEDLSKDMKKDLNKRWEKFIISGNDSFKNEPDDKTMILGVIKQEQEC